ncbi:hypothetical protein [Streptomyces sp. NBC_01689]|uniref:hypothetical protein n=2 Tax=unclassified Streptomyces TaxID=2593676 RepID=UPI002E315BAD|nr:hypothetical protein [Streptomyces sp. NBC_01689]
MMALMTGFGSAAASSASPSKAGAVPGGFADRGDLYAYQTRLNAGAEKILAAGSSGNASVVASPTAHELHVYWNGDIPAAVRTAAARLDVPVVFSPAKFPHSTLVTQARAMAADPRVAKAAPKADGSGLAVTVDESTGATDRAALTSRSAVPVSVTEGPRATHPSGRLRDTAPYSGGSFNRAGDSACTNGVPVRLNGSMSTDYVMLTAAHCLGGDGATVTVSGALAGVASRLSPCRDTAVITYGAVQPRTYIGPSESETSVQVLGARADFVGNLVETSGADSGEHLGVTVVAVDVFASFEGGSCATEGPLTEVAQDDVGCVASPGDSGGPVYSPVGQGGNVLARGTIVGAPELNTVCSDGTAGGNPAYYAPLKRPAGDGQVGSLQFYDASPPDPTIFDLNGRWLGGGPVISVNEASISVDMSANGRPTGHRNGHQHLDDPGDLPRRQHLHRSTSGSQQDRLVQQHRMDQGLTHRQGRCQGSAPSVH